jgi:hypothetical protein
VLHDFELFCKQTKNYNSKWQILLKESGGSHVQVALLLSEEQKPTVDSQHQQNTRISMRIVRMGEKGHSKFI